MELQLLLTVVPHGAGAARGGLDPEEGLVTPAHCALGSGPPESPASANAPGLPGGEDGRTGHGVRAWGLSRPSCVGFLATEATLVGLLPKHLLCILLPGRETGVPGRVTIYLKVVLPLTFV